MFLGSVFRDFAAVRSQRGWEAVAHRRAHDCGAVLPQPSSVPASPWRSLMVRTSAVFVHVLSTRHVS